MFHDVFEKTFGTFLEGHKTLAQILRTGRILLGSTESDGWSLAARV
jgi:hypothetical protein